MVSILGFSRFATQLIDLVKVARLTHLLTFIITYLPYATVSFRPSVLPWGLRVDTMDENSLASHIFRELAREFLTLVCYNVIR
jgi:hypothetical protein